MHVAMEEPELEPCDLFVDIGLLVIEGRTPMPTARGYGEGPHCVPPYPSAVQKVHDCNPLDIQVSYSLIELSPQQYVEIVLRTMKARFRFEFAGKY